jgi:hypothetical protein
VRYSTTQITNGFQLCSRHKCSLNVPCIAFSSAATVPRTNCSYGKRSHFQNRAQQHNGPARAEGTLCNPKASDRITDTAERFALRVITRADTDVQKYYTFCVRRCKVRVHFISKGHKEIQIQKEQKRVYKKFS